MIALLLGLAAGWELEPLLRHDIPRPLPSDDPSFHGVIDLGDLVVVRPQGTDLQNGFTYAAFTRAVEAAAEGRSGYDFATVVHSDQLPTQFSGAAAFHLTYNNADVFGTGKYHASSPTVDLKAALWMSYPSYWDSWGPDVDIWVFGQEMGHYWSAFAAFDDGSGASGNLLGRGDAHWSWFMDTPNSPMEGNRWIDNGDGSFTTDVDSPWSFAPIDLYMMGLIEASDVGPMFYIEPDEPVARGPDSAPEFLYNDTPMTITGTRVDVSIDQVMAVHGPVTPGITDAKRDFTMLPILVVGPEEMLTTELLDRVRSRYSRWSTGWTDLTNGLSTVDFAVIGPDRQLPAISKDVLVPRGAR